MACFIKSEEKGKIYRNDKRVLFQIKKWEEEVGVSFMQSNERATLMARRGALITEL